LNQLQGQNGHSRAQQQPEAAGSVATASKTSNLFIFCVSSQSSWGITAWVASSEFPIQTLWAGFDLRAYVIGSQHRCFLPTRNYVQVDLLSARTRRSRRQAEQLYIAQRDVQTHLLIFLNKC
jgi:hypothetical protein